MDEPKSPILTADPEPLLELRNMVQPQRRGPPDKRNHLSLVQGHLLQLGNIPRGAWEPVSGMLNEYYQFRQLGLNTPPEKRSRRVVWMDDANFPDEWLAYQRDWINSLFVTSQSVDGRQSELMTRSMTADKPYEEKSPGATVTGNSNTGAPEAKKRGWLGV